MKTLLFLIACLALTFVEAQDPKVALEDGPSPTKGRVEITLANGVTQQVCTTDFDSSDAGALCAAAGFSDTSGSVTDYGVKGGLQFVKVQCSGETCQYSPEENGFSCPGTAVGLDCSPRLGTTGSIGLEAGVIAGILVTLVAVIAIVLGLSACLYRNDLIPCLQNSATD